MKKIKVLMAAAALTVGTVTAFAFTTFAPCDDPIGYSEPIDDAQFIIPGTYQGTLSGDYTCLNAPTQVCRYVKLPNGTFQECPGVKQVRP